MDKTEYWTDRLTICAGPDWDERIVVRNEDGVGRPAASSALREAARYLDWVRRRLDKAEAGAC